MLEVLVPVLRKIFAGFTASHALRSPYVRYCKKETPVSCSHLPIQSHKTVITRFRELSNGFFSESNQKGLAGEDIEVPIYEAKMTRDTRLVYTIDCVPDASGEVCMVLIQKTSTYLAHPACNARYIRTNGSAYRL